MPLNITAVKGFLGKAGKGIFETVKSPSVKENFQVGTSRLIKYGGTGLAAAALGAGLGFSVKAAGTGAGVFLKEIGVKDYTPAENMNALTDAIRTRDAALKSMYDEAIRERKAIMDDPTIYGGLGNYGLSGDALTRDQLLKGLGPDFQVTPSDKTQAGSMNWGMIAVIGLALVGGYFAYKTLKKKK